jgi:hypothetical protein
MCRSRAKICNKLLKESFYMIYLVLLQICLDDFCSLKYNYFEPYFWILPSYAKMHLWLVYPDFISVRNIIS